MDGQTSICFKNLITGEAFGYHEEEAFLPASIVKLPLMAAILLMNHQGSTNWDELITIHDSEKVPGCGAVQHMTGDVTLDIQTLSKLMITISDTQPPMLYSDITEPNESGVLSLSWVFPAQYSGALTGILMQKKRGYRIILYQRKCVRFWSRCFSEN